MGNLQLCEKDLSMLKRLVDMEKMFGKEYLLGFFNRIGETLSTSTEAFILGGGAMCFRGQKNGTKDLDIVFRGKLEAGVFARCAKIVGFSRPKRLEGAYLMMKASEILEGADGFRLDIFSKTVCDALSLSDSMIRRAEGLGKYGKLTVNLISNEDIILFKGITERARDADDIAAVIRSSDIDWKIIMEECRSQSTMYSWYGMLYNKFSELEERHGIKSPIMSRLLKLDREELVRNAFERRLTRGSKRAEVIAELKKMGFTKKELESL